MQHNLLNCIPWIIQSLKLFGIIYVEQSGLHTHTCAVPLSSASNKSWRENFAPLFFLLLLLVLFIGSILAFSPLRTTTSFPFGKSSSVFWLGRVRDISVTTAHYTASSLGDLHRHQREVTSDVKKTRFTPQVFKIPNSPTKWSSSICAILCLMRTDC